MRRALAALLLLIIVVALVPSATIRIRVPLRSIQTTAAVDATPLDTGAVERRELTARATGRIEAAPARGSVRFGFDTATGFEGFDVFGSLPRPPRLITIPAGTIVEACAPERRRPCPQDRVAFRTLEEAILDRTKESCFFFDCQVESRPVRVIALENGPGGNVSADAIRFVDLPKPARAGPIYVFNPRPTSRGTFERFPVVSKEDVSAATQALVARLRPGVLNEIQKDAADGDLEFTLLRYTRSRTVSPRVGTRAEEFSIMLDMAARAWGYSRNELDAATIRELDAAAPPDQYVIEDTVKVVEDSARFDEDGDGFFGSLEFTVEALAAPLAEATVVSNAVASRPSSVMRGLLEEPSVKNVSISQWPMPLPLLPLLPWRIEVVFENAED